MNCWVFIVSNLTEVGVRSSRTTSLVKAFARANNLPSAISAWNTESRKCICESFSNRHELNAFFDKIRKVCEV